MPVFVILLFLYSWGVLIKITAQINLAQIIAKYKLKIISITLVLILVGFKK